MLPDFRKAAYSDLGEIIAVFRAAISRMEESGIHQWDERYPSGEDIKTDILRGEMTAGFLNGAVASVYTLSGEHDTQYENGRWRYPLLKYAVLHRLCVNPSFQGRGIGMLTLRTLEARLNSEGVSAVRLDAFSENPAALGLYEKGGYCRVGEAVFRKGLFYLYEKKL